MAAFQPASLTLRPQVRSDRAPDDTILIGVALYRKPRIVTERFERKPLARD